MIDGLLEWWAQFGALVMAFGTVTAITAAIVGLKRNLTEMRREAVRDRVAELREERDDLRGRWQDECAKHAATKLILDTEREMRRRAEDDSAYYREIVRRFRLEEPRGDHDDDN